MTIGIDIRVLGSRTKSGIEEYTENLLEHMLRLDKRIKFKLFYSSLKNELPNYEWQALPNVEVVKKRIPTKLLFASSNFLQYPKVDRLLGGVDVFFSPHFFITALSGNCKRVTTFHDLSYVRFPEFFSWRKNVWHNIEMRPSWQSRFSDKIIAVSESTKNDLVSIYNVDPAKIKVIHSGISSNIKRPANSELEDFRIKNKLPNKFILFLGKLEPRKNIVSLVKAFNIVKSTSGNEALHLIIVGERGWLYNEIFEEVKKSEFKNQIIFKDKVLDNERSYYYSLASVFVYPSFFEGFGFPPLEAMSCKTPVIVSNRASLPEVVGRGGILVDPSSIFSIAQAIEQVFKDEDLRNELVNNGTRRTETFKWDKTSELTLQTLVE